MPIDGMDAVKKMIAKNKKEANDNIRAVYLKGLTGMIKGTPVDEGRARNNWFLSIGVPFTLSGRAASKSGNGSQSSANGMPPWVLNKKIFFTNNLPYIGVLEYGGYPKPGGELSTNGFSNQAPNGWVRSELIRMQNNIRKL